MGPRSEGVLPASASGGRGARGEKRIESGDGGSHVVGLQPAADSEVGGRDDDRAIHQAHGADLSAAGHRHLELELLLRRAERGGYFSGTTP